MARLSGGVAPRDEIRKKRPRDTWVDRALSSSTTREGDIVPLCVDVVTISMADMDGGQHLVHARPLRVPGNLVS